MTPITASASHGEVTIRPPNGSAAAPGGGERHLPFTPRGGRRRFRTASIPPVIRTNAAIAACATALTLVLAGCGGDDAAASSSSSSAAATTSAPQVVDAVKAGTFVVSFRSAFPALASGKDDAALSNALNQTCGDIKAGRSEADVQAALADRVAANGTKASPEEAAAIFQMIKLMC